MIDDVSVRQDAIDWCTVNLRGRPRYFVRPVYNQRVWVTSFYFDQPGDAAMLEMY